MAEIFLCSNKLRGVVIARRFFSRLSNLTTIATSMRFKIRACAGMTIILLKSVNCSVAEVQLFLFRQLKVFLLRLSSV